MSWVLIEVDGGIAETTASEDVRPFTIDWDSVRVDFGYAAETYGDVERAGLPPAIVTKVRARLREHLGTCALCAEATFPDKDGYLHVDTWEYPCADGRTPEEAR